MAEVNYCGLSGGIVRWSHTLKGAKERTPVLFEDFYDDDKTLVCPSGAGMCE